MSICYPNINYGEKAEEMIRYMEKIDPIIPVCCEDPEEIMGCHRAWECDGCYWHNNGVAWALEMEIRKMKKENKI